ncbi:HNH endonuclease [Pseudomonas folii]|uniref:HNH endonuclease n=1 Tax=Pseudomonas folii TaxID=2762593 RepID=A0ABR7ATH9_9PSED|nr:HNH endonuclease [Pseudomonas folii]MBC3948221.1 HNH endonuclease [Pseudomonas folii]
MIKLNRGTEPEYLKNNKVELTRKLKEAISVHGSYKNIPEKEKELLIAPYRHKDVKSELTRSSNGKCTFCECIPSEGGNVEVEHFKPKSIYPDQTFEWLNLLPACRRCNGNKDDHDTGKEPIVNPYDLDPAQYFYYEGLNIKSWAGPTYDVAELTIEVCGLNTLRLWEPRSKIHVSLHDFELSLKRAIANYHSVNTLRKKANRLRSIREAIDRIEMLARESEKYSGFASWFLGHSKIYREAKTMINMM